MKNRDFYIAKTIPMSF